MASEKKIRWAILGAGRIARVFVKDFPFLQNAELVAVASSDKARAAAFAAEHQVPRAIDYAELYDAKDIDAVYIATTHNFHADQALKCLQAGKAVLCEKPITINPTEFATLVAAAKENNTFLMEALWSCFMPAVLKAREWVAEGRIGALKVIQGDFSYPAVKDPAGRLYNINLAGGALLDIGIYPISITSLFTDGAPKQIKARGELADTGVDETVAMVLDYGPITAVLTTSVATRMNNSFILYGEKGSIEMKEFWKTHTCHLYDAEHNLLESFDDQRASHGFSYQMQDATDAILAGRLQSDVVPWSRTMEWQETMMEVRRQIGLYYPNEQQPG